jgi:hypothetical protein
MSQLHSFGGCGTPQVMVYYIEGPGQFQLGTNGFCGGDVHTQAITWSETRQLEELDCESDLYSSAYAGDAAGINQNRNTIRVGKDHECVESHA